MASSIIKEFATRLFEDANVEGMMRDFGVRRRSSLGSAISSFGLFAAGIAMGAAAGMLLAPKSGTEMREDLFAKVNTFREEFGNKFQSAVNKGERYNPPS
jgi:hypothetical protein